MTAVARGFIKAPDNTEFNNSKIKSQKNLFKQSQAILISFENFKSQIKSAPHSNRSSQKENSFGTICSGKKA
jgi:hypothetical protein